jgi:hypothetical protein
MHDIYTVNILLRITAAEMKYMRRTAGYTWTDHKTNTQIKCHVIDYPG